MAKIHCPNCNCVISLSVEGKTKTGEKKEARPKSLVEVYDYCQEKGFSKIDPQIWWEFYESNGWKVGRNPMKSWRAALCRAVREGWCDKPESERVKEQERQKPDYERWRARTIKQRGQCEEGDLRAEFKHLTESL